MYLLTSLDTRYTHSTLTYMKVKHSYTHIHKINKLIFKKKVAHNPWEPLLECNSLHVDIYHGSFTTPLWEWEVRWGTQYKCKWGAGCCLDGVTCFSPWYHMLSTKEQEQWQENLLVTEQGDISNSPWQALDPERPRKSVVAPTCNPSTED